MYGGALIGVKGHDFICFYDWDAGKLVRRIDASVKDVIWSDNGELVAIAGDTSFYVLQYNRCASVCVLQYSRYACVCLRCSTSCICLGATVQQV